jgi:DNA-binding GntR family transcriptional regulator
MNIIDAIEAGDREELQKIVRSELYTHAKDIIDYENENIFSNGDDE